MRGGGGGREIIFLGVSEECYETLLCSLCWLGDLCASFSASDGVWCMFEDVCVMSVYVHVMVCGACARVCVNNACMCSVWGCIYMYVCACDGVCD